MGREIRKVPRGWEHPRNEKGNYQPMYDKTFKEAADEWVKGFLLWLEGKHPDQKDKQAKRDYPYYWQWEGSVSDEEYYRPEFEGEPTCFQIYETVSEGTPASPVFESKKEMIKWLVNQGYSKEAAENSTKSEWAPSMILIPGKGLKSEIHSCEDMKK